MQAVEPSGTLELLEHFHSKLGLHFKALHISRTELGTDLPVFALEHDMSASELELLESTVRSAVGQGLHAQHRKFWLPFVVYATESGYSYNGREYWQTFSEQTPMWDQFGDRKLIRAFFNKFARDFGGVVPKGAFAQHFSIIAWPIANAVMPTSLQRDLARLLHDFESGLTADLLNRPEELGRRLAARSGPYTEQFRIFCSNVTLLGSVAVAMLSHEGEGSPYLISSTLDRIVESLSTEARRWLNSARRVASQVRSRGFLNPHLVTHRNGRGQRLPATTDPGLGLRLKDGTWRPFAVLPDFSGLVDQNLRFRDELRLRRARVDGSEREILPRGWLVSPGLEVTLARLPQVGRPFVELEGGQGGINELLAERCVPTPGPTWLFRRREFGTAIESKGKVVRPGKPYLLLIQRGLDPVYPEWMTERRIAVDEARLFAMSIPAHVDDTDIQLLRELGLSVISDVSINPVGMVPSSWDGEGGIEWLAGEPGMLAISTQIDPDTCVLEFGGKQHRINWIGGQHEQLLVLNGLEVGTHELGVTLISGESRTIVQETILITIRDPQVRPETASPGEGIRVLASPAWPSMSELMDGRAVLTIYGPIGTTAELAASIHSESGRVLDATNVTISLPFASDEWPQVAAKLRGSFEKVYDAAESIRVDVSRSGIGFASIICDRGFKPLRWRISRQHDGSYRALLIDRTDHGSTKVDLFAVERPIQPTRCEPEDSIPVPALGGLLRATAGDFQVSVILPTQPTEVFHAGKLRPALSNHGSTPLDLIRFSAMWEGADLPSDPFARNQRDHVLDAVSRTLVSSIAGRVWARLEERMVLAGGPANHIDLMRGAIGLESQQKTLAASIQSHFHEWSELGGMEDGFYSVISSTLDRNQVLGGPTAARFLLSLAGQPWLLAAWDQDEVITLLRCVTASPVLIRAARFAVLGTRALTAYDNAAGLAHQ